MLAFSEDLALLLTNASVAVRNVSLFIGPGAIIPPGDGPYVTVSEYGGSGPEYVQNQPAPAYKRPTAQLTTRAKKYSDATATAVAAYNAISGIVNQSVNGTWYLFIRPLQEPFPMPLDEKDRIRIVFNVEALKRP